jgi:hypothetical protein
MGPVTAGASLSGELNTDEELLCKLSKEDLALSAGDDMLTDRLLWMFRCRVRFKLNILKFVLIDCRCVCRCSCNVVIQE